MKLSKQIVSHMVPEKSPDVEVIHLDKILKDRLILLDDRGYSCLRSGWYEDAVKAYTEFLKINPADNDARFFRASGYASLKWTRDAVQDLRIILDSDPTDILARHDLSLCYRSLGWKREAIEEMRTAKESADNFGNTDEKKIVEDSLRNLEGEMGQGCDNEPHILL